MFHGLLILTGMNSGPHNPWQSGLPSDVIRPNANIALEPIASFAVVGCRGHRYLHAHVNQQG